MHFDTKGFITTEYNVEERFEQSFPKTKAPLILSDDKYSFWAVSDLHIGDTGNAHKLLASASNKGPSFILFPGDITTGEKEDLEKAAQLFLKNRYPPLYFVAGNHDLYFDSWPIYFSLFGSSTYFFEIHTPNYKDLVVGLESGSSTFGKSQILWLKSILESRTNYRYCFVFTHANITASTPNASGMFPIEESMCLFDLYAQHKVNCVFSGHDHRPLNKFFQNVNYINIPAFKNNSKFVSVNVEEAGINTVFSDLD